MKAFPLSVMTYDSNHPVSPQYTTNWHEGMDLRDYFAAKAMNGMMADPTHDPYPEEAAKWAYKIADAMMEARK
jgi:hypothetical protein